jgi:DnaK suppressor protein
MDNAHIEQVLLEKRRQLSQEVARLENEARESGGAEVEDSIDMVTSAEAKAGSFAVSTRERETLQEIDDALLRLDKGTYGKCVDCGRPIEAARLEAVPWTRYCLADQEKHDREQADAKGSAL